MGAVGPERNGGPGGVGVGDGRWSEGVDEGKKGILGPQPAPP